MSFLSESGLTPTYADTVANAVFRLLLADETLISIFGDGMFFVIGLGMIQPSAMHYLEIAGSERTSTNAISSQEKQEIVINVRIYFGTESDCLLSATDVEPSLFTLWSHIRSLLRASNALAVVNSGVSMVNSIDLSDRISTLTNHEVGFAISEAQIIAIGVATI